MAEELLTFTVDGSPATALEGETLLTALRRLGVEVPTLCHDERLTPYGGCRLCLVSQRDSGERLVPACSTLVEAGMIIETAGPQVVSARRRQLQLLTLSHRMECPVCEREGDCQLQDLLYRYGVPFDPLPFERPRGHRDVSSPLIIRDTEKCILCAKCVRLCEEVQGVSEIVLTGRGSGAAVSTFSGRPLDCEFCGQCVDACPVGALVAKPFVSRVPVWLREVTTTTCSFCSCSCQITFETWGGEVQRVSGRTRELPNRGKLCARGRFGWDVVESEERLTKPLVRRGGRLEETSWEDALAKVARGATDLMRRGRPAVVVGSSRLTCEDAYLLQRFARTVLGTPHVDAGPAAGVRALVEGVARHRGVPRSSASFSDLAEADVVIVLRADPSRTHPLVKTELVQGVIQRGQHLVLAHGLSGGLERHASLHLQVRPGTEDVLLYGVARRLAASSVVRLELESAVGFPDWLQGLEAYSDSLVSEITGVGVSEQEELAATVARASRLVIVVVTGMGISGDEAVVARAASELATLSRPLGGWGGVLVLGEKANVQGVVDVGLHPLFLPGPRIAGGPASRRECGALWGRPVPRGPGWDAREGLRRARYGDVGLLYLVGQDPLGAWPRFSPRREGLAGADLVVVHEAFLTETARRADVVLPVALLMERSGSVVGADGTRRKLSSVLPTPTGQLSDGEIVREVSRRMGAPQPEAERLEQEMTRLIRWGSPWPASTSFVTPPRPTSRAPTGDLLLDASPQLFHSGSVTAFSKVLRGLAPSVALRLCPEDARRLKIEAGEMVRVSAGDRQVLLRARIDRTVRPGTVVALWQNDSDGAAALVAEDGAAVAVELRRSR